MYFSNLNNMNNIPSNFKGFWDASFFDVNLNFPSFNQIYSIFEGVTPFNTDFSNLKNFNSIYENKNLNFNASNNFNFGSFNFNTLACNNFNIGNANPFINFNKNLSSIGNDFSISNNITKTKNPLGMQLAEQASSYIKKVNSDKEGNRLFSNGVNRPWCADFVVYNLRKTYSGNVANSLKGVGSVAGLRDWGNAHECYKNLPSSNKSKFIVENVKVGDIMIEKEPNGKKSHCGIVTEVHADGSFKTVEGNTSNRVNSRNHTANSSTLSGFILMDKYRA